MSGRSWRPISSTSSNPAVVTSVTRAPFRSRSAFVATVEPCRTLVPRSAPARASAASTAAAGSRGVDGSLNATRRPPRHATTSVNVPPVSTPTAVAGASASGRRAPGLRPALGLARPATLPPPLDEEPEHHEQHQREERPGRDRELVPEPRQEHEVRDAAEHHGREVA